MKAIIMVLVLLLVSGCQKEIRESPVEPVAQEPSISQAAPAADAVQDIDSRIAEVDAVQEELSDSDLEKIDQDLAGIDW